MWERRGQEGKQVWTGHDLHAGPERSEATEELAATRDYLIGIEARDSKVERIVFFEAECRIGLPPAGFKHLAL